VFYSPGHDFADALRRVKEAWPDAKVVAWVPAGYEPTQAVADVADEFRHTQHEHYGTRNLRALLSLVRQIRAERYDHFVVLFDSPKLRLLAALSKTRHCAHIPPRGKPIPLSDSPLATALTEARLRLQGRATNLAVQLAVRLLKTRVPGSGFRVPGKR
jgi:hypothetical protein